MQHACVVCFSRYVKSSSIHRPRIRPARVAWCRRLAACGRASLHSVFALQPRARLLAVFSSFHYISTLVNHAERAAYSARHYGRHAATLAAPPKTRTCSRRLARTILLLSTWHSNQETTESGDEDEDSPLMARSRWQVQDDTHQGQGRPILCRHQRHGHDACGGQRDIGLCSSSTAGLDPNSRHGGQSPSPGRVKGTRTLKVLLNAEVSAMQPTADGRLPMDLAADKATQGAPKFGRATAAAPTPDAAATGEPKTRVGALIPSRRTFALFRVLEPRTFLGRSETGRSLWCLCLVSV